MALVTQSPTKRKYGIDVARGVCLVLMMIDHLPSSLLQRFSNATFGPFGFFTAASGFVFLSGFVSATAYGGILRSQGLAAAWSRTLKRAAELYVANIVMLFCVLAGIWFHFLTAPFWKSEFPIFFTEPVRGLYLGLLLIYRPRFFDILPMYVLFLIMVVPALILMRSGRTWMAFGLSLLGWIWVQLTGQSDASPLNPMAYQVCFIGGLAAGSLQDLRERLFDPSVIRLAKFTITLTALLCLVRLVLGYLRKVDLNLGYWHRLMHLQNNGPVRILNFAVFGLSAAFLWVRVSDGVKSSLPFQWLSQLGRHSLQVFIWSIFVVYCLVFVMPPSAGHFWRFINLAVAVSSLSIPATLHEKLKRKSR